jgi:hypothetical protein
VVLRAVAVAALLAVPGAAGRTGGGTPVVFASIESANALVPLGGGGSVHVAAPGEVVAMYQDFRRPLLVVASPETGRVTFADPRTRRVIWSLAGVGRPVRIDAVGGARVYVTDAARGETDIVDLDSRRIVRRMRGTSNGVYARDGARWVTRPTGDEVVRTSLDGQRTRLHVRADRLRADDLTDGVFAVDALAGRAILLSATGRIVHRYVGCAGAADVTRVGDVSVDVACAGANAVAVFAPAGGTPTLFPVGGAPTGVAVAVL